MDSFRFLVVTDSKSSLIEISKLNNCCVWNPTTDFSLSNMRNNNKKYPILYLNTFQSHTPLFTKHFMPVQNLHLHRGGLYLKTYFILQRHVHFFGFLAPRFCFILPYISFLFLYKSI